MYQILKPFGTLNIRGTPCHFLLGNFPLPPSGGQHHHLHWTIKKKIDFNVFVQYRRKLGYSIQRSVFILRHVSPGGPKPVLVDTPGSPWWNVPLMRLCMRYLCRCSQATSGCSVLLISCCHIIRMVTMMLGWWSYESYRKSLLYKMATQQIHGKFLHIIKDMLNKAKSRVKWNSTYGEIFDNLNGVLQGGVISPPLFKIFLEDLPNYLGNDIDIKIGF